MQSAHLAFEPWTSTASEALRAHELHSPGCGTPDPLAQYQAAQEVLQARDTCLTPAGGCAVLQAMATCALARLLPPQWLTDAFLVRHSRVTEAHVASWADDEAFGSHWPPKTRLTEVRRRKHQIKIVHAAVWRALEVNPNAAMDAELFDAVSQELNAGMCGAVVRNRYYEALRQGMPNALQVRAALNSANQPESVERLSLRGIAPSQASITNHRCP